MVALDWLNVSNSSTRKPGSSEGFFGVLDNSDGVIDSVGGHIGVRLNRGLKAKLSQEAKVRLIDDKVSPRSTEVIKAHS
ncbi:MAG: hypothetical protein ACI841_004961 [Planctomycetota bacterium]|jgi:hypothetical protein